MSRNEFLGKRTGAGFTVLLSALAIASSATAVETTTTATKETTININQHVVMVSGRMSLGRAAGEAEETVYIPELGHKLSKLNWDIDNVYMLGLGGSVAPLSWLKFNADVWFKLNDGDGTMDDYDYFLLDSSYTDWSHHENVDLTKGLIFDVNAEMTFYRWQKTAFYGILGFKYDNWKWEARGGDYIYSTFALYDTVGSFSDDELVISYEQKFYAPYLGIGFTSDLDVTPITFSGRFIYSPLVSAEDKDQHHLRNLVFEEDFDDGKLYAVDLSGAYRFTGNFALMASYHFQKYDRVRGGTKITDLTTGKTTSYSGDVAGTDNELGIFSLSAVFSF
jgi:outer membrane protease